MKNLSLFGKVSLTCGLLFLAIGFYGGSMVEEEGKRSLYYEPVALAALALGVVVVSSSFLFQKEEEEEREEEV